MTRVVKISVTGVRNEDASSLTSRVLEIEGVSIAIAKLEEAIIEVKYDNSLVNFNFIKDTIEASGCQVV